MDVPASAIVVLNRKEASANRRRAALIDEIRRLDAVIAEVRAAKATLSQVNGHRPKQLPKIIRNLRLTKKDLVLAAVRHRPKSGMRRREIVEYIEAKYGVSVALTSATTYLNLLSNDGLVIFGDGVWLPT